MQRIRSIDFSLTILVLGSLLFALPSLFAQEKISTASDVDAVPGKVRVKVQQGIIQDQLEPIFFGDAATQFGIHNVQPWLNPDLLHFIDRKNALYRRNGKGAETRTQSLGRIMVIEFSAEYSPEIVARTLAGIPGVEYAEPIWQHQLLFIPNDPDVQNNKQWHLERIKAFDAWDKVRGDNSIVVAILDTGVEQNHVDLKDALWKNPGETGDGKESNGIDDDNNGYVDDWWGYDMAGTDGESPDNDPSRELNDHGTHVAGIVGATGNNSIGVAGVSYGVQLMIVKIADGKPDPLLPGGFEGILYAAAMGADVINCSWGAKRGSLSEQEVIDVATLQEGALVVGASGNDGEENLRFPAGYNHVLSVAATTEADSKWPSSNYHYTLGISAPGAGIYSTLFNNQYGLNSGTSMAAPMVSGAAALLLKQDPTLTPEELAQKLRASADNISLAVGLQLANKMGAGRLNLFKAVNNTDITSARMLEYEVEDENGDGILEKGENVQIRLTVKNVLASTTGVSTRLVPVDPVSVEITNNEVEFGPLAKGETAVSPAEAFRFTVPANAQTDSRIVLNVATSTDENSRPNNQYIVLPVSPTYATTELNRIAATFNSVGNIAYNGMNRDQGLGFYYGNTGSLLFHGGLMIGNSPSTLVDVVRRGPSSIGTDNGFEIVAPYRLTRTPDNTVETGTAAFRDRLGLLGVNVNMTTYEYSEDPNFVIVVYNVTNASSVRINNLHCGLYLDWDLQANGLDDKASWDANYNLGVVQNSKNPNLLIGTALLSDQTPNYYGLDNAIENVRVDFPDSAKWRMLSNGVSRPITPQNIDVGMVIGGGPISLDPNKSERFIFGFLVAEDLTALRQATERAQARYDGISDTPETGNSIQAIWLEARPNPFSNETLLNVEMPLTEQVRIEVFNAQGKSVRLIHEGRLGSGNHSFRFDATDLPSGLYFYELKGESVTARGQLVLTQ